MATGYLLVAVWSLGLFGFGGVKTAHDYIKGRPIIETKTEVSGQFRIAPDGSYYNPTRTIKRVIKEGSRD